jgi:glyoxylase-like metal-dependent hydrolase (beta-lactamase superfamily II)
VADIREVAQNVYAIDDELYRIPRSGSVYFLAEEKTALIDTGPSTSARVVQDGIRQIGFRPEELDAIWSSLIFIWTTREAPGPC